MPNQKPLIDPLVDKDGEVCELTVKDMAKFKPASEVLPVSLQRNLGLGVHDLQKTDSKEYITIRVSSDV
jgi:hypothetical protein